MNSDMRSGKVRLLINSIFEGEQTFSNLVGKESRETLDVGCYLGSAVSSEYVSPNRFTGKIDQVKVELK
jgi:arylsulfatase